MAKFRKTRGRPKVVKVLHDTGTQELERKRQFLIQTHQKSNLYLAESLLGILYARGLLTQNQYDAGRSFGALGYKYLSCLDCSFRARTSLLSLDRRGKRYLPDAYVMKQSKAWRDALSALKEAGTISFQAVLNVVFYEEDLHLHGIPPTILRAQPHLKRGLETLDAYFKGGSKGKKRKPCGPASDLGKATRIQLPSREPLPSPPS